jgi:hypothetical protein
MLLAIAMTPAAMAGSDCCQSQDAAGCQDVSCSKLVCIDDPFCCELEWDFWCAQRASVACGVCACPSDLTQDSIVDAADLAVLLALWGTESVLSVGDLNSSGSIDAADLAILLSDWGFCEWS